MGDWLDEIASVWDAEDAAAGGLGSLAGIVAKAVVGDSVTADSVLASGIGVGTEAAGKVVNTGSDSGWSIGSALKKMWDGIKWEDPKVQAGAFTVGAGVVSGLGAGYFNNKKLEQEKELGQQRLDIERQLANTQSQKLANQNFSNMTFQPPKKGLIYNPATVEPFSKWGQ